MIGDADHQKPFEGPERGANPVRGDKVTEDLGREVDGQFLVKGDLEEEGGEPDKDQKDQVKTR